MVNCYISISYVVKISIIKKHTYLGSTQNKLYKYAIVSLIRFWGIENFSNYHLL